MKRSLLRLKKNYVLEHSRKPASFFGERKLGPRKKIVLIALGLLFILIGSVATSYFFRAKEAFNNATNARVSLENAQSNALEQDFAAARMNVSEAIVSIDAARNNLDSLGLLKMFPYANKQIEVIDQVLEVVRDTGVATSGAIEVADNLFEKINSTELGSFVNMTADEKHEILQTMYESEPDWVRINAIMKLALIKLDDIDTNGVDSRILEPINMLKTELPKISAALEEAIPIIRIFPFIVGYEDAQKYLFLLQNSSELRSGGGFIGTIGKLVVENGEIKEFYTEDVYGFDKKIYRRFLTKPPYHLRVYNTATEFFLRDSNVTTDFPENAAKALWFYDKTSGETNDFDGVVAITPEVVIRIMKITGNLYACDKEFTPENFVDVLQQATTYDYWECASSTRTRKEIINELRGQLVNKIFALDKKKWPDLMETIKDLVAEKHMMFYSTDENLQSKLVVNNWAGSLPRKYNGDFISWGDNNIAVHKTDKVIDRRLSYVLKPDGDSLRAHVEMSYTHTAKEYADDIKVYQAYAKVLIPSGSSDVSAIGGKDPQIEFENEIGYKLIGNFINGIELGETKSLAFDYQLPTSIRDQVKSGFYQLYIAKQPGTKAPGLDIDVTLPCEITAVSGGDDTGQTDFSGSNFKYHGDLRIDREFIVVCK